MQESLALAYQEVFTAIDRLRGGRQSVVDAAVFRQQIRDAVSVAEQRSRSNGYSSEDVRLATFAVLALLDATVLSLHNPVFHDWPKQPMQEEYFGTFNAGEIFFTNIQRLSQQADSDALADVLEVHQLCLLLGFQGRHSADLRGELRSIRGSLADRIQRIRGAEGELSPEWKPSGSGPRSLADPWLRRLLWLATSSAALATLLFILYAMLLHSGVSDLATITWHS